MIAVSYSRLSDFGRCPRYFFEKYVARSFKEETQVQSAGLQAHKALEEYTRSFTPLPVHLEHVAPLIEQIRATHERIEPERELAVDLHWQPCGWKEWGKVYIRVKLDLLGVKPGGTRVSVIDWKTGKISEGRDQMRLAAAVLFAHDPKIEVIDAAYVWTTHRHVDSFTIPRYGEAMLLQEYWDERAFEVQRCEESGNWQPKASGFCKKCPVAPDRCPYAKQRSRIG